MGNMRRLPPSSTRVAAVAGTRFQGQDAGVRNLMLVVLVGCDGSLVHIDVDGKAQTEVEAGTLVEELLVDFGFGEFVEMDLTTAQELRDQGVEPGDIVSVEMTLFTLEAVDGQGDLSFLESMTLSATAPDLDAVEIATCADFPTGEPLVNFVLSGSDFAPHLVSKEMSLVVDITGRRPDVDTTVEASFIVDVGVTAQGVANAAGEGD